MLFIEVPTMFLIRVILIAKIAIKKHKYNINHSQYNIYKEFFNIEFKFLIQGSNLGNNDCKPHWIGGELNPVDHNPLLV
jgi:hypothetical protein